MKYLVVTFIVFFLGKAKLMYNEMQLAHFLSPRRNKMLLICEIKINVFEIKA